MATQIPKNVLSHLFLPCFNILLEAPLLLLSWWPPYLQNRPLWWTPWTWKKSHTDQYQMSRGHVPLEQELVDTQSVMSRCTVGFWVILKNPCLITNDDYEARVVQFEDTQWCLDIPACGTPPGIIFAQTFHILKSLVVIFQKQLTNDCHTPFVLHTWHWP